jgi:nucleotide-binding universal stress UspA family protein
MANKMKRFLAPTDFSEASKAGLRSALEYARREGAEVIVYHVIDIDMDWCRRDANIGSTRDFLVRSRQALDDFLRRNFADIIDLVEVRQIVEFGAPHKSIVEKARSEGVDLIVMSTHSRTGVDRFMLGSTAEKVASRASCPVLVIPRRAQNTWLAEAA